MTTFKEIIADRYDYSSAGSTLQWNPLSNAWKFDRGSVACKVILSPFAYVGGMASYAISLPWRVGGVVKDSLMLVGSFFYHLFHGFKDATTLKERLIVWGGSWAQLGAAVVGVVVPIFGYWIDAKIQSYNVMQKYQLFSGSNPGSIWANYNSAFEKKQAAPGAPGAPIKPGSPNELDSHINREMLSSTLIKAVDVELVEYSGDYLKEALAMHRAAKKVGQFIPADWEGPFNSITQFGGLNPAALLLLNHATWICWIADIYDSETLFNSNLCDKVEQGAVQEELVNAKAYWTNLHQMGLNSDQIENLFLDLIYHIEHAEEIRIDDSGESETEGNDIPSRTREGLAVTLKLDETQTSQLSAIDIKSLKDPKELKKIEKLTELQENIILLYGSIRFLKNNANFTSKLEITRSK